MPERSRRALLASLGTLAMAGCLSGDEGTPGTPGSGTESPGSTPSTTATATPTPEPATPQPPEDIDADWPTRGHDPGRSNYASGSAGPTAPVGELWTARPGGSLSRPVVAGGTLFVGSDDGTVRGLDARTGRVVWETDVGAPARMPQVRGGTLYVDTRAAVVALKTADGTEDWRVEKPGRAPALVADHGVYLVGDGDEPAVVASDAAGGERWRSRIREPWEPTLFAGPDTLFVPSGTHERRPWRLAADDGSVVGQRPGTGGHHFPGEECYHDGCVFAADGFYGKLWAFDVAGGNYDQRWTVSVGEGGGDLLAPGSDHVYAHDRGGERFRAFDRDSGDAVWEVPGVASLAARPVVTREAVLVATDERVRCFDPADGTDRWSLPGDAVGTRFVVVDDLLFSTAGETVVAHRPP